MGGNRKRAPLGRALDFRTFSDEVGANVREYVRDVYAVRRGGIAAWSFRRRTARLDSSALPWRLWVVDEVGAVVHESVCHQHDGHAVTEVTKLIVTGIDLRWRRGLHRGPYAE
jgi:hypothetical protein